MSALLAVVLDVEGVENRTPAGIGASEAAAAVLRQALGSIPIEVVTRAGRLAELLEQRCDLVVLHDPVHPLAGPGAVRAVLEQWHDDGECVAAIGCATVTDTLKHVDDQGRVLATLDREDFLSLTGPLVVTHAALAAAVAVSSEAGRDMAVATEILDRTVGVHRVVPQPAPAGVTVA